MESKGKSCNYQTSKLVFKPLGMGKKYPNCLPTKNNQQFVFNWMFPLTHSNNLLHTGNHTPHGQAASIWTEDLTLALETAKRCFHTSIQCVLNLFLFSLFYNF